MNNSSNNEKRFTFGVEGMTCASCVRIVERSLKKMDGVYFVSVNLGTEKGYVITDPNISFADIKKNIDNTGYKAIETVPGSEKIFKDFKSAKMRMIISLAIMIPLTIAMFFHMSGFHMKWFTYIEFIVGIVVLFWPGRYIFKSAYIAAKHAHANMDTLVAMGALSAWITSLLSIIGIEVNSFGSLSVMLVTIHLTGRYIESRLKYSASGEIRALLAMRPKEASVIIDDVITNIPAESISVGSIIVVRSGENIALDGTVIDGSGFMDESMITGEADRVYRKTGDEVTGGTILEQGYIKVEVTKVGDDTFLSRMIKLVEEAQSSSVPIQAFADRVTGIFVPVIFCTALISAFIWGLNYDSMNKILLFFSEYIPWVNPYTGSLSTSIFIFIAMLVIACPCALGLATPMALIAGSGLAAKRGLLIKNGEAIQKAGDINVIFLDKTGTITEGKPVVTDTNLDNDSLSVVLALENASIHPIAESIKRYCIEKNIPPQSNIIDIEERSGIGVFGILDEKTVSIERPESAEKYSIRMDTGETVVEFKINGETKGYISIADQIKSDSKLAVDAIKKLGIEPIMLTGDSEKTAFTVAGKIGITNVISRVKPDEKLFAIQDKQKDNILTCMVGDGINDAAALKAADIGIALGSGTELSIESADIIITGDSLLSVPDAIRISKITFKKIRQNLFWAFFYNIIAIPIAFLGILHPAIAELCMVLSSINVILNSISIKNIKLGE